MGDLGGDEKKQVNKSFRNIFKSKYLFHFFLEWIIYNKKTRGYEK